MNYLPSLLPLMPLKGCWAHRAYLVLLGFQGGGHCHLVNMCGELTEILGSNSSYNLPKLPSWHAGLGLEKQKL